MTLMESIKNQAEEIVIPHEVSDLRKAGMMMTYEDLQIIRHLLN